MRVFRAYSCEFGLHKAKPDDNEPCKLGLTADLKAKVVRTQSLLDVISQEGNQNDPEKAKYDAKTQAAMKRKWCNEVALDMDMMPIA